MKSQNFTPDFDSLLKLLTDISQTSINLSERMNIFFSTMSPELARFAVRQLKAEWQQRCGKSSRKLYHGIVKVLNALAKDQVCIMDEKFMQMAMELNLFFGAKVLDIRKSKQYKLHCSFCLRFVSNYKSGLKYHMNACPKNFKHQLMPRKRRRQRIQILKKRLKKQGIAYDDKIPSQSIPKNKETEDYPQTILQREICNQPTYRLGQRYYSNLGELIAHQYYIGSTNFDFLSDDMVVIAQQDDNEVYDESMNAVEVKEEAQPQMEEGGSEEEMESERSGIVVKMEAGQQDYNAYESNQNGDIDVDQLSRGNHDSFPHNIPQERMYEGRKNQGKAKKEQSFSDQHQQIQDSVPKVQSEIIPPEESNHKGMEEQPENPRNPSKDINLLKQNQN